MSGELKTREEIQEKYKWDLESMYEDESLWERDYKEGEKLGEGYLNFSGRLGESGETLYEALDKKDKLWQIVEKVYVYARMRKDQNNRDSHYQTLADRSQTLIAKISAQLSFFNPEFLEIPEERVREFLKTNEDLGRYKFLIEVMFREKKHILSKAEENILAQLSEVTSATSDIFSMINNADIRFGSILNEKGEEVELTHGRYSGFMESPHRNIRKAAFTNIYQAYSRQKNTLATTYSYNTKTDVVKARIRKYDSALEGALSGDNVPKSVYHNLIDSVNGRLHVLHRYMELRRKMLNLDEIHMYDVYVPLVEREEKKISFEECLDMMRASLSILGDEYVEKMNKGIEERWMDVYETKGKTSGAYSFGCYNSKPFILLNYTEKLKDVFTVVHEMGHSMHSHFTRETQPFVYGSHSIFTAEVASTVNEALLMHHLIENAKDIEEKKHLLSMHIEAFRTTLFRQTMFAEFEMMTHNAVEKGEVLTEEWLSKEYLKLNQKYFGTKVISDDLIAMEWSRIPHFYRAFYVYKYATGYSAATAISEKLIKDGEEARKDYIEFLRSGESDDPIELLKIAGIDMSKPEPVERAMDTFEALVDQLEKLVN